MIFLTLAASILVSLQANANTRILDCNTPAGPNQQVTVVMTKEGKLKLQELTTSGSWIERPLSSEEFESSELRLRDDGYGSISTLYKEEGKWFVYSEGSGVTDFAMAYCFIEE